MGVGLGCYAEPKQGRLVRPVAKICFILRPLYALCDKKAYHCLLKRMYTLKMHFRETIARIPGCPHQAFIV